MDDAALLLLDGLREAPGTPGSVESFLLLLDDGCPDGGWARLLAHETCRQATSLDRAQPYRIAFAAVCARPEPSSAGPPVPAGRLAVEGLFALPRRERAAIALACLLGFSVSEVAGVLGMPADDAAGVLDAGIDALRRTREAHEPVVRKHGRRERAA